MRSLLFAAIELIDRWLAPATLPFGEWSVRSWLGHWEFAHRGLHGNFDGRVVPENSTAAFAAAIDRGMGIECDVQASSDWQPIVFHDWEFDRLTSESGAVLDRSAAEIAATILSGNGELIPHLDQMLEQIEGQVPILIEIKSRKGFPVGRLCASVSSSLANYTGDAAVMSFDPRVSRWFSQNDEDVERGLVITEEGAKDWRARLKRHLSLWHAKPQFLAYDIRDLPSHFASSQRARGLPVATWTVRSLKLHKRAARYADAPIAEGDGVL